MPFTPYHLGPSSWIGLILFKILDFPTLLVASVVIDIEPFCVFVFNAPWPLHGFLHSFLGGSIYYIDMCNYVAKKHGTGSKQLLL